MHYDVRAILTYNIHAFDAKLLAAAKDFHL
jgi:hypothetical protein